MSPPAGLHLGDTGHGPSRLGLFMRPGYRHWSFFYMVYIPKNNFPTHIACQALADGTVPPTTALTNIKQRNYPPVGVVFDQINGTGVNVVVPATDAGTTLNSMLGGWFGLEVSVENLGATHYRVNMWTYDAQGRDAHILVDEVYSIAAEAQASTWDQFFFGGNNSNSWEWGPTMSSHYYIDDFIIDAGHKGRIGPRYFRAIGVTQ